MWDIENGGRDLPSDIPEDVRVHISSCGMKIPTVLLIDYLFDDQAGRHQLSCGALGLNNEIGKIISIPPFCLRGRDDITTHHLDVGLLEGVRNALKEIVI